MADTYRRIRSVFIDYARRVDLDLIPITERRAALYVDVARAFNQWGKYERAYHAIRQAEKSIER